MSVECNICGGSEFKDFNTRTLAMCTSCGSLERTRLLALCIEETSLPQSARVLHIAPERGIYELLHKRPEIVSYTLADFSPEQYTFATCQKIDLCNLAEWQSESYDLIIHSHVLEHTQCNIAYTLYHIHRMLSPNGRHVFIVPFSNGSYEESFQKISVEERKRKFGQWDHVRRFGRDDIPNHLGKVVKLPSEYDVSDRFSADRLSRANIPADQWRGWTGTSVIELVKSDYLLCEI